MIYVVHRLLIISVIIKASCLTTVEIEKNTIPLKKKSVSISISISVYIKKELIPCHIELSISNDGSQLESLK